MHDQPPANLVKLPSDDGYLVQVELGDGHIRTFGGFRSENEARACIERASVLPLVADQ